MGAIGPGDDRATGPKLPDIAGGRLASRRLQGDWPDRHGMGAIGPRENRAPGPMLGRLARTSREAQAQCRGGDWPSDDYKAPGQKARRQPRAHHGDGPQEAGRQARAAPHGSEGPQPSQGHGPSPTGTRQAAAAARGSRHSKRRRHASRTPQAQHGPRNQRHTPHRRQRHAQQAAHSAPHAAHSSQCAESCMPYTVRSTSASCVVRRA